MRQRLLRMHHRFNESHGNGGQHTVAASFQQVAALLDAAAGSAAPSSVAPSAHASSLSPPRRYYCPSCLQECGTQAEASVQHLVASLIAQMPLTTLLPQGSQAASASAASAASDTAPAAATSDAPRVARNSKELGRPPSAPPSSLFTSSVEQASREQAAGREGDGLVEATREQEVQQQPLQAGDALATVPIVEDMLEDEGESAAQEDGGGAPIEGGEEAGATTALPAAPVPSQVRLLHPACTSTSTSTSTAGLRGSLAAPSHLLLRSASTDSAIPAGQETSREQEQEQQEEERLMPLERSSSTADHGEVAKQHDVLLSFYDDGISSRPAPLEQVPVTQPLGRGGGGDGGDGAVHRHGKQRAVSSSSWMRGKGASESSEPGSAAAGGASLFLPDSAPVPSAAPAALPSAVVAPIATLGAASTLAPESLAYAATQPLLLPPAVLEAAEAAEQRQERERAEEKELSSTPSRRERKSRGAAAADLSPAADGEDVPPGQLSRQQSLLGGDVTSALETRQGLRSSSGASSAASSPVGGRKRRAPAADSTPPSATSSPVKQQRMLDGRSGSGRSIGKGAQGGAGGGGSGRDGEEQEGDRRAYAAAAASGSEAASRRSSALSTPARQQKQKKGGKAGAAAAAAAPVAAFNPWLETQSLASLAADALPQHTVAAGVGGHMAEGAGGDGGAAAAAGALPAAAVSAGLGLLEAGVHYSATQSSSAPVVSPSSAASMTSPSAAAGLPHSSSSSSSSSLPIYNMRALDAKMRELEETYTAHRLKSLLHYNGLKVSGNKAALSERAAEAILYGCIPHCPSCEHSFLIYGPLSCKEGTTTNMDKRRRALYAAERAGDAAAASLCYFCPGSFDLGSRERVDCPFSTLQLQRVPWQWVG